MDLEEGPSNVNGVNYLILLQEFFVPRLRQYGDLEDFYFQQDEALPHFANDVKEWLNETFESR